MSIALITKRLSCNETCTAFVQVVGQVLFEIAVDARYGDQLRLHGVNKDARVGVAFRACQRPATHGCIDVNVSVGNEFRTFTDDAGYDKVAVFRINLLSGADGGADEDGRVIDDGCLNGGRLWLILGCCGSDLSLRLKTK